MFTFEHKTKRHERESKKAAREKKKNSYYSERVVVYYSVIFSIQAKHIAKVAKARLWL